MTAAFSALSVVADDAVLSFNLTFKENKCTMLDMGQLSQLPEGVIECSVTPSFSSKGR